MADELLPRLSFGSFVLLVTGDYDVTPDNHPILGAVEGLPGLLVAAGFSGHGFMLAPAVGRRIADAVARRPARRRARRSSRTPASTASVQHARARDRLTQ